MNLLGMYRRFGVVPQGFVVLFRCSWWWFSESSFGGFLGVFSGPCSWGLDGGDMGTLCGSFAFDSPPKSMS
jgi:hypothetical protein